VSVSPANAPPICATSVRRGRPWLWPLGLALALAVSAGINIGFMIVANRDASFAVEPDYYRKSLEWDQTMAQEDTNRALGWRLAVAGERTSLPGRLRLVARLADRTGRPLDGAVVTVEARHGARAAEPVGGVLESGGEGRYAAELPLARPGLWELRFDVRRDGERFTARISAELPGSR
jgi:nitrogen fixation protein FixH